MDKFHVGHERSIMLSRHSAKLDKPLQDTGANIRLIVTYLCPQSLLLVHSCATEADQAPGCMSSLDWDPKGSRSTDATSAYGIWTHCVAFRLVRLLRLTFGMPAWQWGFQDAALKGCQQGKLQILCANSVCGGLSVRVTGFDPSQNSCYG